MMQKCIKINLIDDGKCCLINLKCVYMYIYCIYIYIYIYISIHTIEKKFTIYVNFMLYIICNCA
jgi:hypothetical protein